MEKGKNGFTLTEVLIVVSIIAVIISVAVPAVNLVIRKSQYERIVATTKEANTGYGRHLLATEQTATTVEEAALFAEPYLQKTIPRTLPYGRDTYILQLEGTTLYYLAASPYGEDPPGGGGDPEPETPTPTPTTIPDPPLPNPGWTQPTIPIFTGNDNIVTQAILEMLAQDFPNLSTTAQLEILQQATVAYSQYLQTGPQNEDRINYLAQLAAANGLQSWQIEQGMQLAAYTSVGAYLQAWTSYESYEMAAMSAYSQWPNYKPYAFDPNVDDPVQWVRTQWNSPNHYSWLPENQRAAAALQDISYQPNWQGNMTATAVTDVINHIGQASPQLITLATLNPNLNMGHKQALVDNAAIYLARSDLPAQTRLALEDSIQYLTTRNPALTKPPGY